MNDVPNHRAARQLAVITSFLDLLLTVENTPEANRQPSENLLLQSVDRAVALGLVVAGERAREEMNQLAPAVMAGADLAI